MTYVSMDKAYYAIYKECMDSGTTYRHRAGQCKEIRPFSFSLYHPSNSLFTGASRRLNYRFWIAETLCYIAGWGDYESRRCAELLISLNSNYKNFARYHTEVGEEEARYELNPMVRYGDGFGQGLVRAYDTLKAKPNSRQAYVSIWNRDTPHSYEESPCLTSAQYFTQELGGIDHLSAVYQIRSNDINWGLPYDVASNCMIQMTLAGALGMQVGNYYHQATSMHYYLEGGQGGVCPPNIHPLDEETWLDNPPQIPDALYIRDIREYQAWAHMMLRQMHIHFSVHGKPGSLFVVPNSLEGNAWAQSIARVIHWRHPK